jgi:hypothetical protein
MVVRATNLVRFPTLGVTLIGWPPLSVLESRPQLFLLGSASELLPPPALSLDVETATVFAPVLSRRDDLTRPRLRAFWPWCLASTV